MLDTPQGGWSRIYIGDWSERCSYLDDVPNKLFYALEYVCRTRKPAVVKFDAEGYEYIIIFDEHCTHIIVDAFNIEAQTSFDHYYIEEECGVLAQNFISDIRRDLEHWAHWGCRTMTEDEIDERRKDLPILCDILEKRI